MKTQTTTYTVGTKTRLDQIFTNGIPVNAFIDKGRCSIGATYGEITNKSRCTIITVPNISILLGKQLDHPEIDIVYEKVSKEDVKTLLTTPKPGHKIMTTPEGMRKIMNAAIEIGRYDEIVNEWFLLLDEVHTFVTENYREDILTPFDYFWSFRLKSIISATPYTFSDSRFKELEHVKIAFTEKLGTVTLVEALSPMAVVDYMLKHPENYKGNLHFMINSVHSIADAINRAQVTDCNIYCADDKEHKNMVTLGALTKYYRPLPKTGEYSKFNFYTGKYFEGWDMHDEDATVILVTDVYQPHTRVGVSNRGKQAMGRLRDTPSQLIHITNHTGIKEFKSMSEFQTEDLAKAKYLLKSNNDYAMECKRNGWKFEQDDRLIPFADIDKVTNIATLNSMKLDQKTHEAANNEIYNHIAYIEQAWQDAYFDTERTFTDIRLETVTAVKRKSASDQLREDYNALKNLQQRKSEAMVFQLFGSVEDDIKVKNPTAYNAAKYLSMDEMDNLNYNVKRVNAAIILKQNQVAEIKLCRLLVLEFKIGAFYTNEYIKSKLQDMYNQLEIREDDGKVKVANASQIADSGRFEVRATKRKNAAGKDEHGKVIIRAQFGLRMAA
jgi:hypothetical protein